MAQRGELKIHIKINSQYQLFDQSGSLPFSIVFGLCRRSSQDVDTRSLVLDTSASVFDVPYALANGLLRLFEGQDETEVDLAFFHAEASPHHYIILPPPVHRAAHWNKDFEVFLNEISSKSNLTRLLKPNTKYTISLASTDPGVRWWSYSNSREILPDVRLSSKSISEATKLVNSKESAGKAAFRTCDYLPSPPNLDLQLRLRPQSSLPTTIDDDDYPGLSCNLEVSITSTNSTGPVSIQSTGHQHFLTAWGPFQPIQTIDDRERLTSTRSAPRSSLGKQNFIIYKSGDEKSLVHRTTSPVCGGLIDAKIDRRPGRSDLTTLWPETPLIQTIDLDDLLISTLKLPDGEYAIEVETLGAWWCWGSVHEIFNDRDELGRKDDEREKEKIPEEKYEKLIPPIWLRSADVVVVTIMDGRVMST